MSKVFVSYRRQDTGSAARMLAAELGARYGEDSIFMDTDSIRVGEDWKKVIDSALVRAELILAIIGPKWIYTHDESGRRRIDNDDDWVRNEVLYGLSNKKRVVPLFVQGAQPLKESSLDGALRDLCNIQSYQISDVSWRRDVDGLFDDLERSGTVTRQLGHELSYPSALDDTVAMGDDEAIASIDPTAGWSLVHRQRVHKGKSLHVSEITKIYKFQNFSDCIHFMNTAARHIVVVDHHPRWENIWINLVVSLTSFDIDGKLTYKDVRLAKYLDELFVAYMKKSEA